MKDDARVTKVLKLLEAIEVHHAKMHDMLLEAKAILTAEPTEKDVVKRLFDCWHELWKRRYSEAYVFAGAKDGANFKRLLKAMPGEEIARRMQAYLRNDDPFLTEKKHPLAMFVTTVNRYGQTVEQPGLDLAPAPVGCTHRPPCRNDVVHTDKLLKELKQG